jgi:hypothetical protein
MAKHQYKESSRHKADPTAMRGTLKTTAGGGAQHDLASVTDMLAEDRKAVAQSIVDDTANVVYAGEEEVQPQEEQADALKEKAQKVLDNDGLTEQEKANQEGDASKSDDATTTDEAAEKKTTTTRRGGRKAANKK